MGYCLNPAALVLEFMEEGNLDSHLHLCRGYILAWVDQSSRHGSLVHMYTYALHRSNFIFALWFLCICPVVSLYLPCVSSHSLYFTVTKACLFLKKLACTQYRRVKHVIYNGEALTLLQTPVRRRALITLRHSCISCTPLGGMI